MEMRVQIKRALFSCFYKEWLEPACPLLRNLQVEVWASGGTAAYLKERGVNTHTLDTLTGFSELLGGRVKTIHPLTAAGILDPQHTHTDNYPRFDLVVVDLYPFEEGVTSGKSEKELIELIDIGGVLLLRAAAKNFQRVAVIAGHRYQQQLLQILEKEYTTLEERRQLAAIALAFTARYDTLIAHWLANSNPQTMNGWGWWAMPAVELRYGENPHQKGWFAGSTEALFIQQQGKHLSFNNILDVQATLACLKDLSSTFGGKCACVIVKHGQPCGVAVGSTPAEAFRLALECDPISAFGGIVGISEEVDGECGKALAEHFFEVLVAPSFAGEAQAHLSIKKNLRVLTLPEGWSKLLPGIVAIRVGDGWLISESDSAISAPEQWHVVTGDPQLIQLRKEELLLAEICVKHLRSNAIAIVRGRQMVGAGAGQPSRVTAVELALHHARKNGFDVKGAVLASDGFFPFADSIELAATAGIEVVLQPGGSLRDTQVIEAARQHGITMVLTGIRHFRHI